jgi:hypothetical protein
MENKKTTGVRDISDASRAVPLSLRAKMTVDEVYKFKKSVSIGVFEKNS